MMKMNPNPTFPQRFLAMEEPPLKILVDFDGGRRNSLVKVCLERETRERAWGEIKE
jgi:hypothetical protein